MDYYRIKTIYYHGNDLGIIQNRDEYIASFKKEVLKADSFFPKPMQLFERRLIEIWKIQEEEFEKD